MDSLISNFKYIIEGLSVTLTIFLVTGLLSVPLGLIGAVGKISGGVVIKNILKFYTWVFRGTPLVLQVFFVYYGFPLISPVLKIDSAMNIALVSFTLNYTAYFIEIFRGGIESIDSGQYDGAKALGFNYRQTLMYIIIPQTVRRVIPPTCSEMVNLVKDTALVSVIVLRDISRTSREIVLREGTISPFIIAALIYLVLNSIIMAIFSKIEDRYKYR